MLQQISFVGIDVAKDRFDLFILPSGERMSVNSGEAGIARLVSRLLKLGPIKIAVEASGGYERRLALNLHEAGLVVYIVPPARVRSFARSLAQHAKTDAIDAQMIARHLEMAHERLEPFRPDTLLMRLSALSAHRGRLIAEKSGLLSQRDTIDEPMVCAMIEDRLSVIAKSVAALDKAMRELVNATPRLKSKWRRLCLVAGVGPVLATKLIADMPELGRVSSRSAAALVGVAPYDRQSGRSNRAGRCLGGRKQIRDVAYMGVLSAIKAGNNPIASFYRRLRAKGKPFKLAMVAAIRKLITILNAIAKTDPAFKT